MERAPLFSSAGAAVDAAAGAAAPEVHREAAHGREVRHQAPVDAPAVVDLRAT